MSKFIPHVKSTAHVTVYLDNKPGRQIPAGTVQYDLVMAAIEAGDENAVRQAIDVKQAVVARSAGKVSLDNGNLMYDGRPIHGALTNRILQVVKDAGDAGPLLLFLDNLMQNPSNRAVTELYGFMEKNDLPITVDGHFLAYKRVNADYTSVHDGKTKNDIGLTVEMPRNAVNDNKDQTCSTGLHFCAESYLSHFGGARVVVCKINPRDVVSIPTDYNDAKGRACRYEIIGELNTDGRALIEKLSVNYDTKFVKPVVAAKTVAPAPIAATPVKTTVAPATTGVAVHSLTDAQVREIRNLLADEWPLASIAKTVGTSARTVARIRDGETYTHVK